jgi:sugar lactone lactonase YvrE
MDIALDTRDMIGEGPVWDDRNSRICWVDIPAGRIHRFKPADGTDSSLELGQAVGSLGMGSAGGYVVAIRDGFGLITAESRGIDSVVEVESEVLGSRMNDGRCDPAGRFWAGTMAWDHAKGAGSLYCLEKVEGSIQATRMIGGLTISNGLDWSPDGDLLYYIDSDTQRVDLFDFDVAKGALSNRRPFVHIPPAEGLPDGMVVDAEGCVWVALFGAGRIRRYTPSARIDRELEVPVSLVTSVGFGGDDLSDLYVTTARHRLTPLEQTRQVHAGSLFVCRPGVQGLPGRRFGWI